MSLARTLALVAAIAALAALAFGLVDAMRDTASAEGSRVSAAAASPAPRGPDHADSVAGGAAPVPRPATSAASGAAIPRLIWNDEPGMYDGKVIWESSNSYIPAKRVYHDCRDTPDGFECDEQIVYTHPYAAYSFEQLASIADFDAIAAYILAERLFLDESYREHFADGGWYEAGVNHFLRAAILSGRIEPYSRMLVLRELFFVNTRGGRTGHEQARRIYIWAKAGGDLGYLGADNLPLRNALEHFDKYPFDDPDARFEEMHREVEKIKRYLIRLKATTTG